MKREMYSTSTGMSKIKSEMPACCMTWPLTRVSSVNAVTSGTSSRVTRQGPKGAVPGKFLPGVNWCVWRCQSRTLTSLKQA